MPIYEYNCNDCNHHFEYLVLRGQEPTRCPSCSSEHICRKMSVCGFFSKDGSGQTVKLPASTSSCSGCSSSSCAGCGH
ncbi:FmdB family zinc ribbon protein [Desulfatirhabdium butyrativorans]|uniref:FmdB family zinc ribbon protein n=1 Tax=Desulfatirhabdium butyrativorans TaxID=340467 RepID=UPI000412EE75|nr:zinc ribbon domain-containing protein [Desulfatirhabdium butyrativorans]